MYFITAYFRKSNFFSPVLSHLCCLDKNEIFEQLVETLLWGWNFTKQFSKKKKKKKTCVLSSLSWYRVVTSLVLFFLCCSHWEHTHMTFTHRVGKQLPCGLLVRSRRGDDKEVARRRQPGNSQDMPSVISVCVLYTLWIFSLSLFFKRNNGSSCLSHKLKRWKNG